MVFSHGTDACADVSSWRANAENVQVFTVARRAVRGVVDRAADGDGLHVRQAHGRDADCRAQVRSRRASGSTSRTCGPAIGCDERTFPVFGDQWRVDAEFLKWKYWALLLGLDSQYRLDRLEGRYRSAAEQNSQPNVAHDLSERTAVDLVALAGVARLVEFPARCHVRQLDVPRHRRRQRLLRLPHARRASSRGTSRGPCSRRATQPLSVNDRRRVRRAVAVAALHRSGPTTTSSPRSTSSINRTAASGGNA